MKKIAKIIKNLQTTTEIEDFFKELLTESEIETLSKRWQILNLLLKGDTQREISNKLQVSLCKVTRGAKILKNKKSVLLEYLKKEMS